jgi:hypothetical protein
VLEECERLVNENGERAAAGDVLACVNDGVNDELTGGATSDPTADVGKVATANLIVSAARPSIDGSIDEAALSGSLPVRVARACVEALCRASLPGSAASSALDSSARAQLRLWRVALLGTALPGSSQMDSRELLGTALLGTALPGNSQMDARELLGTALPGNSQMDARELLGTALLGTALPGSSQMDSRELLEGLQELDTQVGISL